MWSARIISGTQVIDPLDDYHAAVERHEALVRPRLARLRQEVDTRLSELRRLEARHLARQREALGELRLRFAEDARFVLRSLPFALFAERLGLAEARLPSSLRGDLPRDPARWALASLPIPLAISSCERAQEAGYEGEHDCVRELVRWGLRVGPLAVEAQVEQGCRSLREGFHEVPLVYQHQELSFAVEEHLEALDLGAVATRTVSREVAAVALYVAPMLVLEPERVTFSYP